VGREDKGKRGLEGRKEEEAKEKGKKEEREPDYPAGDKRKEKQEGLDEGRREGDSTRGYGRGKRYRRGRDPKTRSRPKKPPEGDGTGGRQFRIAGGGGRRGEKGRKGETADGRQGKVRGKGEGAEPRRGLLGKSHPRPVALRGSPGNPNRIAVANRFAIFTWGSRNYVHGGGNKGKREKFENWTEGFGGEQCTGPPTHGFRAGGPNARFFSGDKKCRKIFSAGFISLFGFVLAFRAADSSRRNRDLSFWKGPFLPGETRDGLRKGGGGRRWGGSPPRRGPRNFPPALGAAIVRFYSGSFSRRRGKEGGKMSNRERVSDRTGTEKEKGKRKGKGKEEGEKEKGKKGEGKQEEKGERGKRRDPTEAAYAEKKCLEGSDTGTRKKNWERNTRKEGKLKRKGKRTGKEKSFRAQGPLGGEEKSLGAGLGKKKGGKKTRGPGWKRKEKTKERKNQVSGMQRGDSKKGGTVPPPNWGPQDNWHKGESSRGFGAKAAPRKPRELEGDFFRRERRNEKLEEKKGRDPKAGVGVW